MLTPGRGLSRIDGGLIAFLALLAVLVFTGGSSKVDEIGQLLAQLTAVVTGTAAIIIRQYRGGRSLRAPFWLLAGFAAVMALQLLPLPPAIWAALPGRGFFADVARVTGETDHWRPISVTPDATISALLGLLPAFACLIALSTVPRSRIWTILYALLVCILFSAVLGISQIVSENGLYFYRRADFGIAAGIFANRNHAALFAALAFPLLAVLLRHRHENGRRPPQGMVWAIAGSAAVLCLVANVATGSRAGLMTGLIGLGSAGLLLAPMLRLWLKRYTPPRRMLLLSIIAAMAVALAIAWLLAGNQWASFQRLRALNIEADGRFVLLAPNLLLAHVYFPVGAGFGSFPQIFRIVEPFSNLDLTYTNHAHNDWLELIIEGGIIALIGAITALIWFVRRIAALRHTNDVDERGYGWLGVSWIGMILIASIFDYPLRTPIFSVIWIIAMALIVIACTPPRNATSKR